MGTASLPARGASARLPDSEGGDGADDFAEMLLRDLRVMEAQACLSDLDTETAVRVERTSRPILHLVLAGNVTMTSDDTRLDLGPGDLALAFYGDGHLIAAAGSRGTQATVLAWTHQLTVPDANTQSPVASVLSFAVDLSYLPPATHAVRVVRSLWAQRCNAPTAAERPLAFNLEQLREQCYGPGASAFLTSLADVLLVHSLRWMNRQIWGDRNDQARSRNTRRVAAAIGAMKAHPDRSWTVAQLAQTVGTSRSTFAASFKAATGETPHSYLRRVRLDRAKMLIESGALSIAEVARRSGYPLPASFSRAFASHHGVPPTAARERGSA